MTYIVQEHRTDTLWRYAVDNEATQAQIDLFRSRASADLACRLLNAGAATVDPHAIVGCRVGMAR